MSFIRKWLYIKNNMYEQYAKIKKDIELLQVIEADLKARIIADMKERGSIKEK